MFEKILRIVPDEIFIQLVYFKNFHRFANLKNPRTFNEKLQWLKLYNRKNEYTTMVDKIEVKKYLRQVLGRDYSVPTIAVWDDVDQIDFKLLPDKFVLKCNHDSGGLFICRDRSNIDTEAVKKKLRKCLENNGFWYGREWPYKNVKPKILAEVYLEETESKYLTDYKWFCFNGEPKIMYVSKDKSDDPRTDFFDMEYNFIDMKMRDNHYDSIPSKPVFFDDMKKISKILSKNIPFIRVDFYIVNSVLYIGELTFFPCSGFVPIKPHSMDEKLGTWINLNKI